GRTQPCQVLVERACFGFFLGQQDALLRQGRAQSLVPGRGVRRQGPKLLQDKVFHGRRGQRSGGTSTPTAPLRGRAHVVTITLAAVLGSVRRRHGAGARLTTQQAP